MFSRRALCRRAWLTRAQVTDADVDKYFARLADADELKLVDHSDRPVA
jgi:hypothetical protein